jgi:hypothetical protein
LKQEQVNAFCRRQQEEGRAVDALWMPAPDLRELALEVIGDGTWTADALPDGAPEGSVAAGILVTEYLNPASGAVMPLGLMPEGGEPMASVRIGEGARTFLVQVG